MQEYNAGSVSLGRVLSPSSRPIHLRNPLPPSPPSHTASGPLSYADEALELLLVQDVALDELFRALDLQGSNTLAHASSHPNLGAFVASGEITHGLELEPGSGARRDLDEGRDANEPERLPEGVRRVSPPEGWV